MHRFWLLTILLAGLLPADAWAGKYNPQLSIGEVAPDWKDLKGVDGKTHSLADLKDKQCVVIVFTCNTCPYSQDYEGRLIALAQAFSVNGKCALVAINSNKVKGDQLPDMQERAEAKGFNFPYLHDDTQQVARSFGANYTPEFVVLDKDRKVVYLGAMDDNADPAKVQKKYVEVAVASTLAGKSPEILETPAVGCAVRYERTRRSKR